MAAHRWAENRHYVLAVLTAVYALNIADRYVVSTLIESIKAEFQLSDSGVGFLTGVALAVFYVAAGIPLGAIADRANRRNMIALAVAAWSLLTLCCGLAVSFWQLLAARIGVGIGEAGGTPPSQSLLADEFPPRERGAAITLYSIGASLGSALGAAGAGWLAELYGWRGSLIAFGLVGLPLALVVWLGLREPPRGRYDAPALSEDRVTLNQALGHILANKALFQLLVGATVLTFAGSGIVWWVPAFLMRSHAVPIGDVGTLLGAMNAVGGTFVTLATAWICARLAKRDPMWLARFVGVLTVLATIPAVLTFWVQDRASVVVMLWLFIPTTFLYIGPTLAMCHNLTPPSMRGLTVAILLFTANIANLVISPQVIGLASDLVSTHLVDPNDSLRYVLMIGALSGFWAAWHYFKAAGHLETATAHQAP